MTDRSSSRRPSLGLLVLAAVTYLPALTAKPGRMPTDTKLYLYLDPGRLVADAPFTWDTRQFAGWVPHQTIAYLWPSGPWFWVFDRLGVPDWVAHRLWIGTLLFLAGLGVRFAARTLGLTRSAAGALPRRQPRNLPARLRPRPHLRARPCRPVCWTHEDTSDSGRGRGLW